MHSKSKDMEQVLLLNPQQLVLPANTVVCQHFFVDQKHIIGFKLFANCVLIIISVFLNITFTYQWQAGMDNAPAYSAEHG